MVDADEGWDWLGEPRDQPFGDTLAAPVPSSGWRRQDLDRRRGGLADVDAKPL